MVKVKTVYVPVLSDEAREPVRARNKGLYDKLPKLIVDFIGQTYGNGGWRVRARGREFVMDTLQKHYRFTPDKQDGHWQAFIWPRHTMWSDDLYKAAEPIWRLELGRAQRHEGQDTEGDGTHE